MKHCRLCSSNQLKLLLDCGPQPVGNRFLKSAAEPETLFSLVLWQCSSCGAVQLSEPIAAAELKPRFDWITYNEPEGHLDTLADLLRELPGVDAASVFAGISFKDDTTLARMRARGVLQTWRLETDTDLGVPEHGIGAETIQDRLTVETTSRIAARRGAADVLLVRHIFEHAHDPERFLRAAMALVRLGGYLVFEVPDCSRAFDNFDFTTLWEEHVLYFTPATFHRAFVRSGLSLVLFECYPYPFENSLVAVFRNDGKGTVMAANDAEAAAECSRAGRFAAEFPQRSTRLRTFLADFKQRTGPVAMFGAGHLACTYLYLHGLQEVVEFVADDNPHKQGMFMPGSRLPILGSSALLECGVKLCLLSVNPESEEKVIARQKSFLDRGGMMASIFPASRHALKLTA